jgi:hypothetical protein
MTERRITNVAVQIEEVPPDTRRITALAVMVEYIEVEVPEPTGRKYGPAAQAC